ncbi:MAG TPA: extracellular solute-binding protein [Burkholderiales bacterium]|nr:extracellular solute-binding protein [Burkholderiales bacterium]
MFRYFGALVFSLLASCACAAEEVRLAHALEGVPKWELDQLAARFNKAQAEFRVVPVPSAWPEGELVPLALVSDTRTAELLARGEVRLLWQVLAEGGRSYDARFIPAVAGAFADAKGRLLALPLTTSTPLLFYNRDAFRGAKLDPAKAPRTWYEMPAFMEKLSDAGSACPLTTAFPAWILLENMAAWHNEEFATRDNGLDGADARLSFNGRLMVRWISMLSSWLKSGYFSYSGRTDAAEARFAAGECAMLTSSSASYEMLRVRSRFELGVAHLPFYDDLPGAPQNTLVGGAALWALPGASKKQSLGVARFAAWLLRPDVQAEWHQRTGFAPVTVAAHELARRHGYYRQHPAQDIAVGQLAARSPTRHTRGMRLAGMRHIRTIIDDELESVWDGKKTPIDALNHAVVRGNVVLGKGVKE